MTWERERERDTIWWVKTLTSDELFNKLGGWNCCAHWPWPTRTHQESPVHTTWPTGCQIFSRSCQRCGLVLCSKSTSRLLGSIHDPLKTFCSRRFHPVARGSDWRGTWGSSPFCSIGCVRIPDVLVNVRHFFTQVVVYSWGDSRELTAFRPVPGSHGCGTSLYPS
jgi:hypothetical protein